MSLKAKVEAIIYAAEEPITLEQISVLLKDVVLAELASSRENLAIEEADSAAEAASEAQASEEAKSESADQESELLPELGMDSAVEAFPEAGPLMPPETAETQSGETQAEAGEASGADEARTADEAWAEDGGAVSAEESASAEASDVAEVAASGVASEVAEVVAASAAVAAPESGARKRQPKKTEQEIADDKAVRARVRELLIELVRDYTSEDRGMEIRQVAGGFRMATKPEHHDVVRAFAKSLKPPIRLSLAALETLAVVAYKQPITGPEISEIRGVESASVLGTLLDRKLITTAGRKQVIGRPMQYKTSKDFLLRFGLNDVNELPSMEEFSQLASDGIEIAPAEEQQTPSLFEPAGSAAPATEAVSAEQLAEEQVTEAQLLEPQSGAQVSEAELEPQSIEPGDSARQPADVAEVPESQATQQEDQQKDQPIEQSATEAESQPEAESQAEDQAEHQDEHPIGK